MNSVIVAAIVCLTVLVLAERARPLLLRLVKLAEYRAALLAPSEPSGGGVPPLPPDLAARVNQSSADWERADLVGAINQHFVEARQLVTSDEDAWIAVRERLRPEVSP